MKAAIEAWGGEALLLELAKDTKESIAARAAAGERADVLLTIGGASVGEHDLVRSALEEKGARFEVLKAAMRPGKPVMFGFMGEQRVLSLPGNPASAIICARVFLKPLISALLGLDTAEPLRQLPLAHAIGANGEREHYMRAVDLRQRHRADRRSRQLAHESVCYIRLPACAARTRARSAGGRAGANSFARLLTLGC